MWKVSATRGLGQVLLFFCLVAFTFSTDARSRSFTGQFEQVVRKSSGVGDSVPVRDFDRVFEGLVKKTRKRKAPNPVSARRVGQELGQLLKKEPAVLKKLKSLSIEEQTASLYLLRGGRHLKDSLPDLAIRGKLIRQGGAELIAAAGRYGDAVVNPAFRFQSMLEAGRLVVPAGIRAASLQDFVQALVRHGKASLAFYEKFIAPHWKTWVAG